MKEQCPWPETIGASCAAAQVLSTSLRASWPASTCIPICRSSGVTGSPPAPAHTCPAGGLCFSGYLFIPHTEIDRTRLRLCRGLAREDMILSDPHGRPLRVRASVIAELREHEQAGVFDEQPAGAHRPGSIAAVRSGPCAGMEVLVAAVRSRTALQVLTPLFGGARATVAARDVAAA